LFLTSEISVTPYRSTPLSISDILLSGDLLHDLLKIEMTTIEEERYNSRRYS
jgi:hypothetical protein